MNIMYRLSRNLFKLCIKIGFRLKIIGLENFPDKPFIVAANHTSLLDPPIVGAACNRYIVYFMVKQELFEMPVIRHWSKSVNCIPVRRGDNSIKGLRETLKKIKEGKVVGIFPEGTRSVDGELREAKVGTGFLIAMAKVPVVPIYVYGTAEAFPKGKKVKWGTRVGALIGKPLMPEDLGIGKKNTREDYDRISNKVMDTIAGLKEAVPGF
jgi:1-acyl-sn-glycerol-3-phosphate acyltransferase